MNGGMRMRSIASLLVVAVAACGSSEPDLSVVEGGWQFEFAPCGALPVVVRLEIAAEGDALAVVDTDSSIADAEVVEFGPQFATVDAVQFGGALMTIDLLDDGEDATAIVQYAGTTSAGWCETTVTAEMWSRSR